MKSVRARLYAFYRHSMMAVVTLSAFPALKRNMEVKRMTEINMCGRKACCPKAEHDKENRSVTLTENGNTITLTCDHIKRLWNAVNND